MNIIEKEIEKRMNIIEDVNNKKIKINDMIAEINKLQEEVNEVNIDVLNAEVEELKTYLPKVEAPLEDAQPLDNASQEPAPLGE